MIGRCDNLTTGECVMVWQGYNFRNARMRVLLEIHPDHVICKSCKATSDKSRFENVMSIKEYQERLKND